MRDILLIDNFDSFSYNLVEEFACLGCNVEVQRNDRSLEFLLQRLRSLRNPLLVISPGPGTPEAAGICVELIRAAAGLYPILGICLGHQAITVAFGGVVGRAPKAVHGERSRVQLQTHAVFAGLPKQISVGRYHSLVAAQMPACLRRIASVDQLVMALAHEQHAIIGLQFHPESILTTAGRHLLGNVVQHLNEVVR